MDDDPTLAARHAELERVTIGVPKRHDATIRIDPYDPAWPSLYEREAERIRGVLGERVRLLEHVGSTSVPGMAAKPIIDIVLAVPDSSDEPAYVPDLEAAGYLLRIREPEPDEHRMFKGPDTNVNLHVYTEGELEIRRMLAFRDRLRTHPEERERYLARKRELATRTWAYVQDYADAKGEVVEAIIGRALAEST